MADVIDPMDLLHYGASDASLFTNESVAVRDASKNEFQSTSTSWILQQLRLTLRTLDLLVVMIKLKPRTGRKYQVRAVLLAYMN